MVSAAIDGIPAGDRDARVGEELDRLTGTGLAATELDLRESLFRLPEPTVGPNQALREAVAGADLLWLRGGNVFALRHALAVTGLDQLLLEVLADDSAVVGGYSAGPCVLGTHLRGLDACDDATEVPRRFGVPARFDGLGVLDRPVVPHLDSPDHFESAVLERVAERHRTAGEEFIGLRDGDVLVTDGPIATARLLPRKAC